MNDKSEVKECHGCNCFCCITYASMKQLESVDCKNCSSLCCHFCAHCIESHKCRCPSELVAAFNKLSGVRAPEPVASSATTGGWE